MRNSSDLKQKNLLDITKVIRNNGPVTKPEIARLTKLTSVTAHNFIGELLDKKVVAEVGISKSNGGRKAVLYEIASDYGYIIGQNLGRNYICTSVCDINLKVLYKNKIKSSLSSSDSVIDLLVHEIEVVMQELKLKTEECFGIGVTVPGQVNHDTGSILNLLSLHHWRSFPIKSIIEKRTGIRTYVENDNNATAISAKWLKLVDDDADVVFITIAEGVGTGVLSKGTLFYGHHSYAGELGHTIIWYNGPQCSCGNRGCIEALVSDGAIIKKVKEMKKGSLETDSAEKLTIMNIVKMAKAGDQDVYSVLKEVSCFIGIAINHLVKVYDPETIVIQNNWLDKFQELYYSMVESVFSMCAWAKRDSLKIIVEDLENIESLGPASLVLENMFARPEDNPFIKKLLGIK